MFCGPRESIGQSTKVFVGVGNVKARNTRFFFMSVICLYNRAKTRVRVDSELSEDFEVKVGMHQGSVLSPFFLQLC